MEPYPSNNMEPHPSNNLEWDSSTFMCDPLLSSAQELYALLDSTTDSYEKNALRGARDYFGAGLEEFCGSAYPPLPCEGTGDDQDEALGESAVKEEPVDAAEWMMQVQEEGWPEAVQEHCTHVGPLEELLESTQYEEEVFAEGSAPIFAHPEVLEVGSRAPCGCFITIVSGDNCVHSKYRMVLHGMLCSYAVQPFCRPAFELSAPMRVCEGCKGRACSCPELYCTKRFRFEYELDGNGAVRDLEHVTVTMQYTIESVYDKPLVANYSEVHDEARGLTAFFIAAPALCPKSNGRRLAYRMAHHTVDTIDGPLHVCHARKSGATQPKFMAANVRAIVKNNNEWFNANPLLRDAIYAIAPGASS